MQDKKYLLQFLATIKGNKYVESALRKMQGTTQTTTGKMKSSFQSLDKIHQKTGANVGRVSKIISTSVSNSVDRQGRSLKHVTTMWSGVDKQMHKTSFTAIRSKGAWHKLSNTFKVIPAQLNKMGTASAQMIKALKRVMIVVPMWMLFRSAMRGVLSTIRLITTGLIDLDEAMARIKTVTHGTAKSIEKDMTLVRGVILKLAVKTRASIKELAEAYYFLKTANLETEEAMSALIPTMHVMIGTGNSAKDTARAMAGMYNTMGESLGENLTLTAKMVKIADILTYTYATQDVQLSELIQSYTKLAPYISGLSDSFLEVVTLLGFLNTKLLRAGRTGRLTGRAILQITKSTNKLEKIFGILFDKEKPLSFLGLMEQLHDKMGKNVKITARQSEQLRKIFGTRGAIAVRLTTQHWSELARTIELAEKNASGFAEKMFGIKMDTIRGQMKRLQNIVIVSAEAYLTASMGTDTFKEALTKLNDNLENTILFTTWLGISTNVWAKNLRSALYLLQPQYLISPAKYFIDAYKAESKFVEATNDVIKVQEKLLQVQTKYGQKGFPSDMIKQTKAWKSAKVELDALVIVASKAEKHLSNFERTSQKGELDKYINNLAGSMGKISETLKENYELRAKATEEQEKVLSLDETRKENMNFLNSRLKLMGVSRRQLAELQLKQAEYLADEHAKTIAIAEFKKAKVKYTDEMVKNSAKEKITLEDNLAIMKAQNEITLSRLESSRTIAEKLVSHEVDLMKIRGISGSQLIRAQIAIEQSVLGRLDETRALELALALEKELTKEKEAQKNLSSESIKLWKIALKYGVKDAEAIAQLLKGEIERKDLSESQLRIFEEQFRTLSEQMKASEYFFEGKGKKIGIRERIPTTAPRREIWETERKLKEQMIGVTVPIDIKSEINIRVDGKRVTESVITQIVTDLRKNSSKLKKAIDEAISDYNWKKGY